MYRRGIQIGKDMKNEEATEEATVRLEMTNEEPTVRFETLPLFMESNSSDDSTPATSDDLSRNESSDTDSNESSDTASNESSQTTSTETPQTASNELPQPLLDHGPKVLLVTQVSSSNTYQLLLYKIYEKCCFLIRKLKLLNNILIKKFTKYH